jgi:aryl sulfotransferase
MDSRHEFDDLSGIDSSILTDEEIDQARPLLYRSLIRRFKGPLILRKVHDRCWRNSDGRPMFPPELSRGAVYIARDPRDVAVSYADFASVSIDEMIRRMADPTRTIPSRDAWRLPQFSQPLGTWSGHVLSWLNDAGMPLHLVRYEDLLADPAKELANVAVFLGLPCTAAREAAISVRFEALRAQEERQGFRELINTKTRFFRTGQAEGWRAVLSTDQAERIQEAHGGVMARLGYL